MSDFDNLPWYRRWFAYAIIAVFIALIVLSAIA